MARLGPESPRLWLTALALAVVVGYAGTQLALGDSVFAPSLEGFVTATVAATLVLAVFVAWVGSRFLAGVLD